MGAFPPEKLKPSWMVLIDHLGFALQVYNFEVAFLENLLSLFKEAELEWFIIVLHRKTTLRVLQNPFT
jgi:hypothetical protein